MCTGGHTHTIISATEEDAKGPKEKEAAEGKGKDSGGTVSWRCFFMQGRSFLSKDLRRWEKICVKAASVSQWCADRGQLL